jgi:hypothetical protein
MAAPQLPLWAGSWRLGATQRRALQKPVDVAGGDDAHQLAVIDDQRATFAAANLGDFEQVGGGAQPARLIMGWEGRVPRGQDVAAQRNLDTDVVGSLDGVGRRCSHRVKLMLSTFSFGDRVRARLRGVKFRAHLHTANALLTGFEFRAIGCFRQFRRFFLHKGAGGCVAERRGGLTEDAADLAANCYSADLLPARSL